MRVITMRPWAEAPPRALDRRGRVERAVLAAYVILKAEVYERMKRLLESRQDEIPAGICRSQDPFFRDLPERLKDESLFGQCVAYRGDERIGIAPSDEPLIREISRSAIVRRSIGSDFAALEGAHGR